MCLQGLVFLHSIPVAHADLKSPNILLNSKGDAKIADVGLGKIMSAPSSGPGSTDAYSPNWAAPEQKARKGMFSKDTILTPYYMPVCMPVYMDCILCSAKGLHTTRDTCVHKMMLAAKMPEAHEAEPACS